MIVYCRSSASCVYKQGHCDNFKGLYYTCYAKTATGCVNQSLTYKEDTTEDITFSNRFWEMWENRERQATKIKKREKQKNAQ